MSRFIALTRPVRRLRGAAIFMLIFLVIEFLDEFVFGVREAAWPLIRTDLGLDYYQIGLLLTIPAVIASFIEPVLGILADVWRRRLIVLIGGVLFGVALLGWATSTGFAPMMLAFILFYPASGAFVSLSQSTLMDIDPSRHEHNMARWTVAGSLGWVVGSLGLSLLLAIGLGWRIGFIFAAVLTFITVIVMSRMPFPKSQTTSDEESDEKLTFRQGVGNAVKALRRREVLRWLTLLQFSDLMLDVLYGYLALYFVDVVGTDETTAAFAVSVWTCVGLLGDFLLIPLLERVRGLSYLRISVVIELILFPAFLLVPNFPIKLIILGLLGFFNSGWYSILQGQLYTAMPSQSGTVLTIANIAGLFSSFIPLVIGWAADQFGLHIAIWLLILGPVVLLIGLLRQSQPDTST